MKNQVLLNAIQTISGAAFLGLDTVTVPTLKGGKKNEMQGRVTKHMTGANVLCFGNSDYNGYISMIRNRLIKEGKDPESYQPGPRKWGTRVPGMPLIEHYKEDEDQTYYYLEVIFLNEPKITFKLDGKEIAREDIEGLDDPEKSFSQAYKDSQGGLSDKVPVRSFRADSIVEIRVNNEKFN